MRRLLGLGSLIATLAACEAGPNLVPVQQLRIATGDAAGGAWFYTLGSSLARLFNERVPGVHVVAEPTQAFLANVNAITDGVADLAFARADLVYSAYSQGTSSHPAPHTQLRGIAVMYLSTLHIVVRADSAFRSSDDLRSARIAYSLPAEEDEARVQNSALFDMGALLHEPDASVKRMRFHEITQALSERQIDGGFLLAGHPLAVVSGLATTVDIRLLEVAPEAIADIRSRYPFYKPATIPAGTYKGQMRDVRTIGVEILMVCRADLDEALVYRLTRTLFDGIDQVAYPGAAGSLNPDLASATPVPLHRGAARYYRERELLEYP